MLRNTRRADVTSHKHNFVRCRHAFNGFDIWFHRSFWLGIVNYVPHAVTFCSLNCSCIPNQHESVLLIFFLFQLRNGAFMQMTYYSVIDVNAAIFVYFQNSNVPNFRPRCSAKSACIIDYMMAIFLTRAVIPQQMGHYFLKLICKLNVEISVPVSKEVPRLYGPL